MTKLNTFPSLNRQIKAWLKSGVILDGQLFPTNEGTPQGGCISPLLALVALYGLETAIRGCVNQGKAQRALSVVFYADDFVRHEARTVHGARAPTTRRRVVNLPLTYEVSNL